MSSIPSSQPIPSMRISSHNYALRQLSKIPPGAPPPPDIPNPLNYPDADTQVTQRAKPIRVFTDFYSSKYGFEFPSFREFVLMHQGLHHHTGWYDFPTPGASDFKTKFYGSEYRNNGNTTGLYRLALRRLSTSFVSR
jgi:hypothetical protein